MSRAVKSRDRSLPPGNSSALGASNPGLTWTYISHLRLSLTCVEGTPRCNLRVEPERGPAAGLDLAFAVPWRGSDFRLPVSVPVGA